MYKVYHRSLGMETPLLGMGTPLSRRVTVHPDVKWRMEAMAQVPSTCVCAACMS